MFGIQVALKLMHFQTSQFITVYIKSIHKHGSMVHYPINSSATSVPINSSATSSGANEYELRVMQG